MSRQPKGIVVHCFPWGPEIEFNTSLPLVVELARAGVVVPDLYGAGFRSAVTTLQGAGLDVDVAFDTTGREVSKTAIPPEYDGAPVLVQQPDAGAVVAAATRVRIVVASPLRRDPVVTMPSLVGLTLTETREVLERLGLQIGTTTVRST
jgi:beta-lactam-binding protein with PASTA domain